MHKIIIEKECGCFRRSDLENNIELNSKDDALIKALRMKDKMNQEFCRKHDFQVAEKDSNFIISFAEQRKEESSCCGTGCCS